MASIIDGGVSIFKLVRQSEDRVIEQREGEKGRRRRRLAGTGSISRGKDKFLIDPLVYG